jgi:hypothetical protein
MVVLAINPGAAAAHQLGINIEVADPDLSDRPAISVRVHHLHPDCLPEDELG